jgi:hypothetical protein
MPLYAAGQKIRGSEINALPQLYRTVTDQSAADATPRDAVGLGFQGEINAWYLIECFLFYKAMGAAAGGSGDIRVQWRFPSGVTGWWGADGINAGDPGGSVGQVNRQSILFRDLATSIAGVHGFNGGDATVQSTPPGVDVFAKPAATIQIAATPGTVQLQFGQLSANATATILRAGSCIRVSRLA